MSAKQQHQHGWSPEIAIQPIDPVVKFLQDSNPSPVCAIEFGNSSFPRWCGLPGKPGQKHKTSVVLYIPVLYLAIISQINRLFSHLQCQYYKKIYRCGRQRQEVARISVVPLKDPSDKPTASSAIGLFSAGSVVPGPCAGRAAEPGGSR